jgi:hypothetical protein
MDGKREENGNEEEIRRKYNAYSGSAEGGFVRRLFYAQTAVFIA